MHIEEFFKKIGTSGLVVSCQGNFSYRTGSIHFYITRTNVPWNRLTHTMLHDVEKDGDGWETNHRASTDWMIHAQLYDMFPKVQSILHTHPPYVIAWSNFSNGVLVPGHDNVLVDVVDQITVTEQLYDEIIVKDHGLYVLSDDHEYENMLNRSQEIEHAAEVACISRMLR